MTRRRVNDVDQWIVRLRKAGVGEASIRNQLQTLRSALTQAVRWGGSRRTRPALASSNSTTIEVALERATPEARSVQLPEPQDESRTCISMPGSLPGQGIPAGHGERRHGQVAGRCARRVSPWHQAGRVTEDATSPSGLEPIEAHLRDAPAPDPDADLVVRGWPLTVDGLLSNADATRSRFSFAGAPLAAISAEVAAPGWSLDEILAGPRLRTRSRYATATVGLLLEDGFALLPSFAAPHVSVVLHPYTSERAQRLLDLLGEVRANPHHVRRRR